MWKETTVLKDSDELINSKIVFFIILTLRKQIALDIVSVIFEKRS